MDKFLIKMDGDNIKFSNLKIEGLVPKLIIWECVKCGEKIMQDIDSETPNHCYFCEVM